MGLEYFKRPVFANGFQVNGASTFTAAVTLSGAASDIIFSGNAGTRENVQTVALSGASAVGTTAVTNRGVTFINSTGTGAGWTLPLTAPAAAGMEKIIWCNPASTVPVTVRTASSSHAFYGSTANAVSFSTIGTTGNIIGKAKGVRLLSVSATQWAVIGAFPAATTGSTYVTLLGATA